MNERNQVDRFEKALWSTVKKLGPEITSHTHLPLTAQQFFMMYHLSQRGECKVNDLAEHLEVKPSAITVMIDRLIKHGVAERRQDDKDRRVVLIQLTEQGHAALEHIKSVRKQIVAHYLEDVEPERLEIFLQVFEQISHKLTQSPQPNPLSQ